MSLPFGISVRGGHHLRKIDNGRPIFRVQKDVELIEVAVNQPKTGQLDNQIHEHTVQGTCISHTVNLATAKLREKKKEKERERVWERGGKREIWLFLMCSCKGHAVTNRGCPSSSSMTTACRLKSTGSGTGNPLSCKTYQKRGCKLIVRTNW